MPESFSSKCAGRGADLYRKIANTVSTHDGISDEQIANYTGIPSIDLIRMILKDLAWSGMIIVRREFDPERKWFTAKYYAQNTN